MGTKTIIKNNISIIILIFFIKQVPFANHDWDLTYFKGNISCYILLLKYPLALENTKSIACELSLIVSLLQCIYG